MARLARGARWRRRPMGAPASLVQSSTLLCVSFTMASWMLEGSRMMAKAAVERLWADNRGPPRPRFGTREARALLPSSESSPGQMGGPLELWAT
eukprot:scaffold15551_cov62-Phaeocystis_antarctica.AAC.7